MNHKETKEKTLQAYRDKAKDYREKLGGLNPTYARDFIEFFYMNEDEKTKKVVYKALQNCLKGQSYINAISEPYKFFEKLEQFYRHQKLLAFKKNEIA